MNIVLTLPKSTLYKRFYMENPLAEIDVQIIKDPYTTLAQLFNLNNNYIQSSPTTSKLSNKEREFIVLPLFSDRGAKRHVPEKKRFESMECCR